MVGDGTSNPRDLVVDSEQHTSDKNDRQESLKRNSTRKQRSRKCGIAINPKLNSLLEIVHPHFSCADQIAAKDRVDVRTRKGRWVALPENVTNDGARGNFDRAPAGPDPERDFDVFTAPTSHSIVIPAQVQKTKAATRAETTKKERKSPNGGYTRLTARRARDRPPFLFPPTTQRTIQYCRKSRGRC